jgi:hypothetical protein
MLFLSKRKAGDLAKQSFARPRKPKGLQGRKKNANAFLRGFF